MISFAFVPTHIDSMWRIKVEHVLVSRAASPRPISSPRLRKKAVRWVANGMVNPQMPQYLTQDRRLGHIFSRFVERK